MYSKENNAKCKQSSKRDTDTIVVNPVMSAEDEGGQIHLNVVTDPKQ